MDQHESGNENKGFYDSVIPLVNFSNSFFKDKNTTNAGLFFNGFGGIIDSKKPYPFVSDFSAGYKKDLWPDLVDFRVRVNNPESGRCKTAQYVTQPVEDNINDSTKKLFHEMRESVAFKEIHKGTGYKNQHAFVNKVVKQMKIDLRGSKVSGKTIAADSKHKDNDWYYKSIKIFDFDPRTAIVNEGMVKGMKTLLYTEGILMRKVCDTRLYRGDTSDLFKAFVENRLYRFGARDKDQLKKVWDFIDIKSTDPVFYVQTVSYLTCILSLNEKPYDTKVDNKNTVHWLIAEVLNGQDLKMLNNKKNDVERNKQYEEKRKFFASASLSLYKHEFLDKFKSQFKDSKIEVVRYRLGKAVVLDQDFGHNFSSLFVEAFGCRNPRVFNCFVEIFSDFSRTGRILPNVEDSVKGELHTKLSSSFKMMGGWMLSSADEAIRNGECAAIQSVIWPRGRSLHTFQNSSFAFSTLLAPTIGDFPETYGVDFLLALSQTRQFMAKEDEKWSTIDEPPTFVIDGKIVNATEKDGQRYGKDLDEEGVFKGSYERATCVRD